MTDIKATGEQATTVFAARRVITMDPELDAGPAANAVAVSGGRVSAVGQLEDLRMAGTVDDTFADGWCFPA